ncbi:hypothetical protein CA13_58280 [Planctomycetes bacterium CA13]|uniref:Uncharacterized protein n=1 Tax=Novipirellula herctigrandis TaxID=2527986 RepID=A0A5C5ZC00_9BACT|nr:hypothetical protein CA13_58280 [Planctomycetes bacterium CA13]
MPRQKFDQPAYRYHISGQAVVSFCGKNFYLRSFAISSVQRSSHCHWRDFRSTTKFVAR